MRDAFARLNRLRRRRQPKDAFPFGERLHVRPREAVTTGLHVAVRRNVIDGEMTDADDAAVCVEGFAPLDA